MKCKKKVDVASDKITEEKTARGRSLLRSVCPNCGTRMAKFA
ncbi:MAG: DUF5679 domain-containing protein [Candidatus Bathyarchaeia archaeon]